MLDGTPSAGAGASAPGRPRAVLLSFFFAALTLALGAFGSGCAADATRQPPPGEAPSGAEPRPASITSTPTNAPPSRKGPFRAGTFNAGLAVGILEHAESRAEPVVERLAQEPLDLLCVQEFWLEEHWQKLVAATADKLPFTHRLAADPGGAPRCGPDEVAPLASCAAAHCSGAGPDAAPFCLLRHCLGDIQRVSGSCLSCLGQDPRRPLREISKACLGGGGGDAARRRSGANPSRDGRAGFFGYGGSFGTGLLTNIPILERDARVFPSALSRRGVLYARLDAPVGQVHAFCTHLTANIGAVPHPQGGTWVEDQRREIDALLAFMREKGGEGPIVLLGDLNTGPGVPPHISPLLPSHYDRLLGWGLWNPLDASGKPRCTYCFDNPLRGGAGTYGTLIDHVLVRGLVGTARSDLLRAPLTLDDRGRRVRTGYSDHYGVVVDLSRPGT